MDPMLATGGTAVEAINILKSYAIAADKIVLISVIATYEGIHNVLKYHPDIKAIIIGKIDKRLNDQKFIAPGLGDFGERFYSGELLK